MDDISDFADGDLELDLIADMLEQQGFADWRGEGYIVAFKCEGIGIDDMIINGFTGVGIVDDDRAADDDKGNGCIMVICFSRMQHMLAQLTRIRVVERFNLLQGLGTLDCGPYYL